MTSTESFFDALKQHRESQKIEISEICEFTKINPRYIQAIESGDLSVLPTVYMRLFLRAYAEFIGADSAKALLDFEMYTTGTIISSPDIETKPKPAEPIRSTSAEKSALNSTPQLTPHKIGTWAVIGVGIFAVLYWAGKVTSQQNTELGNALPPTQEQVDTVVSEGTIGNIPDIVDENNTISGEKKNP